MISLSPDAFSLRPLGLALLPLLLCASPEAQDCATDCVYEEQGGLLVVEVEAGILTGDWVFEQAVPNYTGTGYYRWNGPNYFTSPGHGTFGFCLWINEPGHYNFNLRNHHDHPDPTEENDVWIKMDDDPWIKTFSPIAGNWTWQTRHELSHDDKPPASYDLTVGLHYIQFSGRSSNFRMDRFHLSRPGHSDATHAGQPESDCHNDDGNYCVARPNSTGVSATMNYSGSTSVAANDLEFIAREVPPHVAGIFFFGELRQLVPFGDGVLCIAAGPSGIQRFAATYAGGAGRMRFDVDLLAPPSAGLLSAGSTWNFQAWFRDPAAGGGHFNLSDGLTLTFTP